MIWVFVLDCNGGPGLGKEKERGETLRKKDGKRKDSDPKDRQFNKQTSDFFKEKEWVIEESEGIIHPLRC
ncbi:hypothetical protein DITRI_Ditri01bG0082400 [Diplodiscus trichospermus]